MIVFKKSIQLTTYIKGLKAAGKKIGFVPTMGALHKGHLSLFEKSKAGSDITVCSIFINPTQFNDIKDFQKYPVTIEKDLYMLEAAGVELVFLPDVAEIYPGGVDLLQQFDLGALDDTLEGKFRPNHFQGVSQVMSRLIDIVAADNLYMGQKDYQQCMVVQRLLQLKNSPTLLIRCATQREDTGLAMSSRNTRLSAEEKQRATAISAVLTFFKKNLREGNLLPMVTEGKEMLNQQQFKIDYVEIADRDSLAKVSSWDGRQPLVALIAAFMNEVRLIDNMILTNE